MGRVSRCCASKANVIAKGVEMGASRFHLRETYEAKRANRETGESERNH
jgi:hypothetical protein